MSKSKYEYVKNYESPSKCLPDTFILVRIDGKGFSKFTQANNFDKPNDSRGLRLMNLAALEVCRHFNDIFLAYGQSDEFSFMMGRDADVYSRRREKICSTVVSLFTGAYNLKFQEVMERPLVGMATFDSRVVEYPTLGSMKDYFRWRQVDCHINNLYNTCFWSLVLTDKVSQKKAEKILKDTVSADKHEMLFSRFQINYAKEPAIFRKGSLIVRTLRADPAKQKKYEELLQRAEIAQLAPPRLKMNWEVLHCDLIQEAFWQGHYPKLD